MKVKREVTYLGPKEAMLYHLKSASAERKRIYLGMRVFLTVTTVDPPKDNEIMEALYAESYWHNIYHTVYHAKTVDVKRVVRVLKYIGPKESLLNQLRRAKKEGKIYTIGSNFSFSVKTVTSLNNKNFQDALEFCSGDKKW